MLHINVSCFCAREGTVFKLDLGGSSSESVFTAAAIVPEVHKQTVVEGFDPSLYEAKQLFFASKDGTSIPMFVVHAKTLRRDNGGDNPCLLCTS